MSEQLSSPPPPSAPPPRCVARVQLRYHGPIELFYCDPDAVTLGAVCIVSFDRGQDFGKIIALALDSSVDIPDRQRVVRVCLPADLRRLEQNAKEAQGTIKASQREVTSHKLPMKIVGAEFTFDRSKIVFYFAAEDRVDFRELVRDMARQLKMRIELRQVGIRDETKIIGGFACCGRVTCCSSWIHEFSPVNIRMAKTQQIQLHPAKLSGVCNRLKCCLAYEYTVYRELQDALPGKGQRVRAPQGTGDVVDITLLSQEVTVKFDDGTVQTFPAKDITVVSRTKARAKLRAKRRRGNQPPDQPPGTRDDDRNSDDRDVPSE